MNGYKEAEKIDKMITKLIEKHGITAANCADWMILIRTVGTGLHLIERKVKRLGS